MASNLVIVESPTKCKTIGRYLGKEFTVMATMGHIADLPVKKLGVDIENDFTPEYVVSRDKKKVVKELKEEVAHADTVFLAPDPDREGEAIAWHVARVLKCDPEKIKRIQFNEITKNAITDAISNPRTIDINRVNAQQARRILDRVVGYKISPLLWKVLYRGLSAGRVQSVALRIICEREDEIRAFVPEEYWTITAHCSFDSKDFQAQLHSIDGKKASLKNEEEAKAVLSSIEGKSLFVDKITKKEKRRNPYPPFITSTLQQDAARKYRFSASKTMMVAQQLYEGLSLGKKGTIGLITYMRTDSVRISNEALQRAKEFVDEKYPTAYHLKKPRQFGTSKKAQDAHEAIRPAHIAGDYSPEALEKYLNADQLKLYTLIWNRFIASQMAPARINSTKIDLTVDNKLFRATGSVIAFDGFLRIYEESKDSDGDSGQGGLLPDLVEKTSLPPKSIESNQHFTKPPARYSEALLVNQLEKLGIGRPSTYAQIIKTLSDRKYVELDKRRFFPTELGYKVKEILTGEFENIFNVSFTAEMEERLDTVETGEVDWVELLKSFYSTFSKQLDSVQEHLTELKKMNQEETDRLCPQCKEHNLIIRWSRNGKFLACPGFPSCKYAESLEQDYEESDEICDKCGSPMRIIKRGAGRFLGCSNYPTCKNIKSFSTGVPCPEEGCDGDVVERSSRRGKIFYGCSKYPDCKYVLWDKPVAKPCETCGFEHLVEKNSKKKGTFWQCPKCKAEYATHDGE
ncbi:type I DNA topoisomerase [Chitinivibrio alkaliphilus]|uniref:DNA topoisomerase 1 n=1 Tax=Chitinivibrio alkaliphilus ACht1 TaxID=1313304 RepID=U7DCP0_9BACT|nr:type I DNA topoisomerase [Chitinivibrio alkaliphilus]ERP39323.1 DNA topoisomerase I [Chitinivibrio alkaliphilus ACht1]